MFSGYAMVIDDPSKIDLLGDDLKKRFIQASIATVNVQAALTRKNAIENIKDSFNLRNNFTLRNLKYTPCPKTVTSLNQVQSEVGISDRASYMELQEKGGVHSPRKGGLVNIPTDSAREGGTFAGKVSIINTVKGIKRRKVKGPYKKAFSSQKARAVARAYVAQKLNFVVHYGKDVFTIDSFHKSGDNISFDKTLIRNLKHSSTKVEAKPWLEPAGQKPAEDCQTIFNSQMNKIENKKV